MKSIVIRAQFRVERGGDVRKSSGAAAQKQEKGAAVNLILSAFQSVDLTILSFCDFPGQILYHVPETNSSLFHLLTQSHAIIELTFF